MCTQLVMSWTFFSKCRDGMYCSHYYQKSNVGDIWYYTSLNLYSFAGIISVMLRTSWIIHRIKSYIRISDSIAWTSWTSPHNYLRGFFMFLFFFDAVVVADLFLSLPVAFFAVGVVIVVPPFSFPLLLSFLSPSSSARSPSLRNLPTLSVNIFITLLI